jgi:sterol desaturase/sphingolipid hydroxylase (fatty acid hydroxylase superfamily)
MDYAVAVLALGLIMLGVERLHPGRNFERVDSWHVRAVCLNLAQASVAYLAAHTWDQSFPELALWRLGGHGLIADALLGYFVITFVYYWWHRARHESTVLWRWLHQVHHSACSLEVLTSFYKHPVEILINGVLSSAILYALLGLDAASSGLALLFAGAAELFYHWNVKTPHWLGYMIQRPESHCIHHLRGWHRSNYSDLPLWDMLFGTFDNPRTQPMPCGFGAEGERRLGEMLVGRIVSDGPAQVPLSSGSRNAR